MKPKFSYNIKPKEPRIKSAHKRNTERLERPAINQEAADKLKSQQLDLIRVFVAVFETPEGQKVLDTLDKYSHKNFPNYENVNATYSKIGEQALVAYIKSILFLAKKAGE